MLFVEKEGKAFNLKKKRREKKTINKRIKMV